MATVSERLEAIYDKIDANGEYLSNGSPSEARAFIEACQSLLIYRASMMSKGGGTQEEMRFDHASIVRMLQDARDWLRVNKTSDAGISKLTHKCARLW